MSVADPNRDAYGLALAWLDDDPERLRGLLAPYLMERDELHLLLSVLNLMTLTRDLPELRAAIECLALAGAGRRPDGEESS